jgi:branched-chain amino acid transport system ATP-binding protein
LTAGVATASDLGVGTETATRGRGLAAEGVRVVLGGIVALDGVSIAVEPGEVVGLIGPNGAGKTTFFNAVCGFVRPAAGRIRYGGRELRGHRPHDLPTLGIARTLQGVGLWRGLTVVENVMLGAQARLHTDFASALLGLWRSSREEAALRRRAGELLGDLGVAGYARMHPDALPYGVQKKVALARALLGEPTLLLLDEPASGLSAEEMGELRELIARVRARTSVLLVEHHMDFVMSVCDRVTVLDHGRVIAEGTSEAVRGDPQVATAYLGESVAGAAEAPGGDIGGSAPTEGGARAQR